MNFNDDHQIIDHVVFSPAERALVAEQAETLKVELDAVIAACKVGTGPEVMKRVIAAHAPYQYIDKIMQQKSAGLMMRVLTGDLHNESDET